jgi:hypothetical protein
MVVGRTLVVVVVVVDKGSGSDCILTAYLFIKIRLNQI